MIEQTSSLDKTFMDVQTIKILSWLCESLVLKPVSSLILMIIPMSKEHNEIHWTTLDKGVMTWLASTFTLILWLEHPRLNSQDIITIHWNQSEHIYHPTIRLLIRIPFSNHSSHNNLCTKWWPRDVTYFHKPYLVYCLYTCMLFY